MNIQSGLTIDPSDLEKYQNPIPNRESIISLITRRKKTLNRNQLTKALKLSGEQQIEGLRRRLNAMVRDEQIYYNRDQGYGTFNQQDLIQGTVKGHHDGFGFLLCDDARDDVFLNKKQMRKVFDGDTVQVLIGGGDRKGRQEGIIVNIVEHNTPELVGHLISKNNQLCLIPANPRITNEIQVAKNPHLGLKAGQYVVAKVTQYPKHNVAAFGQVTEVIGDKEDPGLEINVAIANHKLPNLFPADVLQAANGIASEITQADRTGRVDLTDIPFVTIDGEDARDFDDAVYCHKRAAGGWRLSVAIADVSHYVLPESVLDQEAQKRGTSIYFPQRVVPMLPETLSNGLCSLNPNVDRLAIVCEMTLSRSGKMTACRFVQAVIRSHARLTYDRVNTLLTEAESPDSRQMSQDHPKVHANIHQLHQLYAVLRKARTVRGAVDFETAEVRYQFNDQQKIGEIVPQQRNDAHRMIEECMLCANVAAAKFLQQHKVPALYRTHTGPQQNKLNNLQAFLADKGLSLAGGNEPQPRDYDSLLTSVSARTDAKAIQLMLLRSLGQAQYEQDNQGHFGLAYPAYVHFTSPIRRYSDLLVHRAIRTKIGHQSNPGPLKRLKQLLMPNTASSPSTEVGYPYDKQTLQAIAKHCSTVSRRADKASSDVESWLECKYMSDSVGKEFVGSISNICNFGLFVELADTQIECSIHKSTLDSACYSLDASRYRLIDKSNRVDLTLGDNVRIRISGINMLQRKIECELVSG